jgi:TPP-dependent pyruvate/acetoin dehydrogenase alpha subunit
MTYRFKGHYIGDPGIYRTKAELGEWKKKDPIKRLSTALKKNQILSAKDIRHIEEEARNRVTEAEAFALNSPEPKGEEAYQAVYE